MVAALDLWTLFVVYVFGGSFLLTVVAMCLVMAIIMAFLGRISPYTVTWYILMFIIAMTLGYGYMTLNIIMTLLLIVACIYSVTSYLGSRQQ